MATEPVFVFGSNEAGRHGKGAAKWAVRNRGARWGQGHGHWGNSYAIPTKDRNIKTLPLGDIAEYVAGFRMYAAEHPDIKFEVTPIGCGLAGYKPEQIAPMFKAAPENVILPPEFIAVLQGALA